jgi:prolyl-tRNA synthetase
MTPARAERSGGGSPITPRAVDFPRWYQDVVSHAEMAENGPVRGTMVIRPWGYGIWELLQSALDERIKATGASNAYFPMLIPEAYLRREAEHVEGFSPELAVVTHGGGRDLEEPLVIRPTSETIINSFFSKWVQSHRDLPLLINQWANVVRWELRPRLFLRTTEFLWQEGHTVHASEEDAQRFALHVLEQVYRETMESVAAIPVLTGQKTDKERFAGAVRTWTCEGMMGDGKALQLGTSHELGQNFARAFDIRFSNEEGELAYGWQTSWGVSTRLIGGLIMVHGDDFGLRLPPLLAPVQVVVMVVRDEAAVRAAAETLAGDLRRAGWRVRVDDRTDLGFGRRSVDWEIKGVPVRVEVGPRDLSEGRATLVQRHRRSKEPVALPGVVEAVNRALGSVTEELRTEALAFREAHSTDVDTLADASEVGQTGFARVPWKLVGPEGEEELARQGLTVRCLHGRDGSLSVDGSAPLVAEVGRTY